MAALLLPPALLLVACPGFIRALTAQQAADAAQIAGNLSIVNDHTKEASASAAAFGAAVGSRAAASQAASAAAPVGGGMLRTSC